MRGDGQPRLPQRHWWHYLAGLLFILFLLVGTIVVFGAVVVGVFVIPEWIVGAITPTLAAGLTGLFFAFLGFGTLIITAAHPDRWYVSPVRLVSYVVIWVLLGLMGVAMLVYAITQPPSGSG